MTRAIFHLPATEHLPPFTGATQWFNTDPLTPEALRGKVVLVNFWTYTCVNWLRTLPYVRAWSKKYRAAGLVVLGVHTPEFALEHDLANVQQAIQRLQVDYPVVVDNDYAIWNAFANHYWPALYFADAQGRIRYNHFGEGEYEMCERVLQQLLAEAGAEKVSDSLVDVDLRGTAAPADWTNLGSAETYLGYDRANGFVTPGGLAVGRSHTYDGEDTPGLNQWALQGAWTVDNTVAVADEPSASLSFRFHARDLNLVMGPVTHGGSVQFRVRLDGEPPHGAHGEDADAEGNGTATEQRMYQLIRSQQPIQDRLFQIEFLQPGAQVLVFTFG
ncbi:MAG TPA: thioredoxin family protein [Candidatus Saccharimonadales bacterium]|nr:thioredoxin family protein [Candidatus Saccharimonadales bacterium]